MKKVSKKDQLQPIHAISILVIFLTVKINPNIF